MVEGQVVALDAIDPVDLEEEAPYVAHRFVVDGERLVDADRLLPVVRRRPLLGQAIERVPDRPPIALEERVDEGTCTTTALRARRRASAAATSRACGRSCPAASG